MKMTQISRDAPSGAPAPALSMVRTLMSMPCASVGVGQTCRSVIGGAVAAGFAAELDTSRNDGAREHGFALHSHIHWPLSLLPHRMTRRLSVPRTHAAFLDRFLPGDVAYLWPSVPYRVFRELHDRGIAIATEMINTRMADAGPVLDAAYESLGLPPRHRITPARIEDEEERLSLATAIFSPSPATDESLRRAPHGARLIQASYGISPRAHLPPRPARAPGDPVTFLFIGLSAVRKGLHHLLEAWRDVPANARLRIVGLQDPDVIRLFADVLGQPNVFTTRYSDTPADEFAAADAFILPSLEEGDPIVTYEAASFGLPVIASPAGAGRIGAETGSVLTFDTSDIARLRQTVADFTRSEDLRRDWGARTLAASRDYGWTDVARRRFTRLAGRLATAG